MRFRNMLTTAKLIAAAALMRTESRGGHYRSDFPEPDPAWRHRTFITLADADAHRGRRRECPSIAVAVVRHDRTCPNSRSLLVADAVRAALREDLGRAGDITSAATIPADATRRRGVRVARRPGVIAGLALAAAAFREIDPTIAFAAAEPGRRPDRAGATSSARVDGPARAILSAERVALNFLGHLSGIATATAALVAAVAPHQGADHLHAQDHARACAPSRNTPCAAAAAANHRFGLDDAILIKDNHIAVAGGVAPAIERRPRLAGHLVKIEVEVDTLDQLREALTAGPTSCCSTT